MVRNVLKLTWVDLGCRGVINELVDLYVRLHDPVDEFVDAVHKLVASRRVCIITGFPIPPRYMPETDGVTGSILLAYVLQQLGADAVVAVERQYLDVFKAAAETLGIKVLGLERSPNLSWADTLVFIEKPGLAGDGRYRTMRGLDVTDFVIDSHTLAQNFIYSGKPVIAIGDGGNEVGFGKLPLKPPVTSTTPATHLILASVSDIGAYALAAVVAAATARNILPDNAILRYALKQAVAWGAVDGIKVTNTESVDAVPADLMLHVYELMKKIALRNA